MEWFLRARGAECEGAAPDFLSTSASTRALVTRNVT
jgi:hypothetical protein